MKIIDNLLHKEGAVDRTHYQFEHIREPRPAAMTPDRLLERKISRLTPGCNAYLHEVGAWAQKHISTSRARMQISYSVTYHGLVRHVDTPAEAVRALRQLKGEVAA